jgi:peroxiredoxin
MKRVGEEAPDFNAPSSNDESVILSEWTARGPVVLYFYNKDFTPG